MRNTNPKQFRAELKDYLDLATKEPIRVQRRSGENFILLKEESYRDLQNEVIALQRRLLGMSQIVSNATKEYEVGDRSRLTQLSRITKEQHKVRKVSAEIYHRMSVEQKWNESLRLRETAWQIKAAGVRARHPQWSDDVVQAEVKKIFLYAHT